MTYFNKLIANQSNWPVDGIYNKVNNSLIDLLEQIEKIYPIDQLSQWFIIAIEFINRLKNWENNEYGKLEFKI